MTPEDNLLEETLSPTVWHFYTSGTPTFPPPPCAKNMDTQGNVEQDESLPSCPVCLEWWEKDDHDT